MKYTYELSIFYKNTYKELIKLAVSPVPIFAAGCGLMGAAAGQLLASACSFQQNNIDRTSLIGLGLGLAVGTAIGVPFLTTSIPAAIAGALIVSLSALIAYPVALALDLCSFVYSLIHTEPNSANIPSMC